MAMESQVNSIAQQVIDLTSPDDLFRFPEFIKIYENPEEYLREARDLLASPDLSDLSKSIVGYAMQRLPEHAYLAWLGYVVDLTEAKRLSVDVLQVIAFPPLNWNTVLVERYERADVRIVLDRIMTIPNLDSQLKDYVARDVLSGQALRNLNDLREAGQIPQ